MDQLTDRLPILLEEAVEDIPYLRKNANDLVKDQNGSCSSALSNVLRFIGVAEYIINSNVSAFRKNLQEAASIRLNILRRFDNGEPISKSYISMLAYKALYNALASGVFETATGLALLMGGRDDIEKENDHPFDSAMGYALKALVLNLDVQGEKVEQFKAEVNMPDNKDFIGYAEAFEAIQNKNVKLFVKALQSVVTGHKKQCKGSGVFKGTEDEVLCVWGIGLANLARLKGLEFQFDDPLIPATLIAKVEN